MTLKMKLWTIKMKVDGEVILKMRMEVKKMMMILHGK
jgi:hypothetical protein